MPKVTHAALDRPIPKTCEFAIRKQPCGRPVAYKWAPWRWETRFRSPAGVAGVCRNEFGHEISGRLFAASLAQPREVMWA